jgi:GNAT superfamily N-acetyltransferase
VKIDMQYDNGSVDIVIRRPIAADGPAIEAMFARCSLDSRYARFLASLATIPVHDLAQILAPAAGDEAWVGVPRDDLGTVVAVGSWARLGADAELALIVEDAWQRHGIGSTFLAMLAERAWSSGVCRLTASVLRESRHVLRMLRTVLGPTSTHSDGYLSYVTIDRCGES